MDDSNFYRILCDGIEAVKAEALVVIHTLKGEAELKDMSLHSLGLDSVELFELIGYFEDHYSITVRDSEVFNLKKIGEIKQLFELSLEGA
jgi:acyl carrier protein